FLNVHLKATITSDHPYISIRNAHFDTHSGRKSEAHCAKPSRGDMAIGTCPAIVARSPHLVLPDIGDDDSLTVSSCPNSLQNAGRIRKLAIALNALLTLVLSGFPGANFVEPCTLVVRGNRLIQSSQWYLCIRDDRYGCHFDLVHLRRV